MLALPIALQCVGAMIAAASGGHARPSRYLLSLAVALVLALVSALAIARQQHAQEKVESWFALGISPWIATALVAATLLTAGRDGVHRWLSLGPISLHVSSALAPFVIASVFDRSRPSWRWSTTALCLPLQCVHFAQPDLAQSVAFALAVTALSVRAAGPRIARGSTALSVMALAAATALRRDPLGAVPEVEQIVRLAWRAGPWWWIAAVSLLVAWASTVALGPRGASSLSMAFAVYAAALPVIGAGTERFPVAWLGAGAGPVIGAFVMIRALWNRRSQEPLTRGGHREHDEPGRGSNALEQDEREDRRGDVAR